MVKLSTSVVEIEVLLNRINQERIDLQPDFQRAFVWTNAKKQRLIDTVLRNWHVPPIHFVMNQSSENQSILDGQQRLTAIWDFANDKFPVNGKIDPSNSEILELHGMYFSDLPVLVKRRFLRFEIQIVNITDYSTEEPFELFFRLNEPVSLTSAEKRNAFFGPARDEVRILVDQATEAGWSKQTIGFTNLRMAYDDVLARTCLTLELRSLREHIPGTAVTKKYRSGQGFPDHVIDLAERAMRRLVELPPVHEGMIRFNRATLFSWLIFIARIEMEFDTSQLAERLGRYIGWFENVREALRAEKRGNASTVGKDATLVPSAPALFSIYDDRATARVLDANSVLARDAVIWALYASGARNPAIPTSAREIVALAAQLDQLSSVERKLFEFIDQSEWGVW